MVIGGAGSSSQDRPEQLDYGGDTTLSSAQAPALDFLADLPANCDGHPFPLVLAPGSVNPCDGVREPYGRLVQAVANPTGWSDRIQKNLSSAPAIAAEHELTVGIWLSELGTADPALFTGLRDLIHQHVPENDPLAAHRWVTVGYLANFYTASFGTDDCYKAAHHILRANQRGTGITAFWGPELECMEFAPVLSTDLSWTCTGTSSTGWVGPGQSPDQKLRNPDLQQVRPPRSLTSRLLLDLGTMPASSDSAPARSALLTAGETQALRQAAGPNRAETRSQRGVTKTPGAAQPTQDSSQSEQRPPVTAAARKGKGPAKAAALPRRLHAVQDPLINTGLSTPPLPEFLNTGSVSAAPVASAPQLARLAIPGLSYAAATSGAMPWTGFAQSAAQPSVAPLQPSLRVPATTENITGINVAMSAALPHPTVPVSDSPATNLAAASAGPVAEKVQRLFTSIICNTARLSAVAGWYHNHRPAGPAAPAEVRPLTMDEQDELGLLMAPALSLMTRSESQVPTELPIPVVQPVSVGGHTAPEIPEIPEDIENIPVLEPELEPTVVFDTPGPANAHTVTPGPVQPIAAELHDTVTPATPAPVPAELNVQLDTFQNLKLNGLKLPAPPLFDGAADNSNPKAVRHFLRNMSLLIRQTRITDPVLYASHHLTHSAADWRDIEFLPGYSMNAIIPWEAFETALIERFVSAVSCWDALDEFKEFKQHALTVQEYNAVFKLRRSELMSLPYITVPDRTAQITQYLNGLSGKVYGTLKMEFMGTKGLFEDLDKLMLLAIEAEQVNKRTQQIRDASLPAKTDHAGGKSQKRPRENSGNPAGSPEASTATKKSSGGKPKKKSSVSEASPPPATPGYSITSFPQWPKEQLKSKLYGTAKLQQYARTAKKDQMGPDGIGYPNLSLRLLSKRDNEKHGRCYGCMDQPSKHTMGECPNPNVSPFKHALTPPVNLHLAAEKSAAPLEVQPHSEKSENPENPVVMALVKAQPYQGLTMLFSGAVQKESVNVLLDTGSSHNYCRKGLSSVLSGGTNYSVTLANNSVLHDVSEKLLNFCVQKISCSVTACEMQLPDGIDIILGQGWMKSHHATLLMNQGNCTFVDDDNLPAIWKTRNPLKHDPFNSRCIWTSASRVMNSVKKMFVAFVRCVKPNPDTPAVNAHVMTSQNGSNVSAKSAPIGSHDRLDNLFVEQGSSVAGIRALVKQFAEVFPADMPDQLPPDRGIAHTIPLVPGSSTPAARTYRLSKPQREEMEAQISDLLKKGWIQPSTSPFGSPIIFVKKKDGGMRMCIDYRAVNKITIKNAYPLPRIDDLLDRLTGAKIFSCLDLQQAYHQVRLHPDDVSKTAFTTPVGLFEYLVLPFGLSNAPSTFQALINSVLGPELSNCCLVYLDDIVVFSDTPEQHIQHLRLVLSKLQGSKLFAKLSKCRFALSSIKFLGHVVDEHGITPDPEKIKIVQDWPTPTSVTAVRSFVGLAQYFRKFIQGFSSLISPLTKLFRKHAEFAWTAQHEQTFADVKAALTSVPCLKLPDANEPFTVITDACGVGIGGVLMQADRPVAFDGRRLTETEMKWSTTEQEMLGVVYHLEKWRCYLEGVHFTVVTDHQPNVWFASQKVLSPRLARWYEKLASFDFTWQYRPGRLNVADPLSRHPTFCNLLLANTTPQRMLYTCLNLRSSGAPAEIPAMLKSSKRRNWDLQNVLEQAHAVQWKKPRTVLQPKSAPALHKIPALSAAPSQISESPELLPGPPARTFHPTFGRPHSGPEPRQLCSDQYAQASLEGEGTPNLQLGVQSDPEIAADPAPENSDAMQADSLSLEGDASPLTTLTEPQHMLQLIKAGYAADPLYSPVEAERRSTLGITAIPGGLFMRGSALCVPDGSDLHRDILRELHCSPYSGHLGMNKTYSLIKRHFYWPHMQDFVNTYVRGCVTCQRNKPPVGQVAGKIQPLPVPSGIWEDVSMDFVGPLPQTARHHDYILVVVDRLSKMAHFLPCKSNITGQQTAQLFVDRIWSLHGLPKSVVTDRGRQFLNKFNSALCKLIGTQHNCSSAYHPESDGQTERINRVLGEMLRHFTNFKYDNWDLQLPLVEFAHNNAPTTATGMSPFFCCYGKNPLTPMSAVIQAANSEWEAEPQTNKQFLTADTFVRDKQEIVRKAQLAMQAARQRMEQQEDGKRKSVIFQVGDQVSLKTKHLGISTLPSKKLFQPWMGPFTVSKVINDAAYQLELPTHWKAHNVFHVSLLKPYISNGEPVDPQSFTLVGGKDNEFEVETIVDYAPKTLHQNGKSRKVSELFFYVKWRGIPAGVHERQPFKHLKGTAPEALSDLAIRLGLPSNQFEKGSTRMPTPEEPS